MKKIEKELREIQHSSGLQIQEATITLGITSGMSGSAGAGISVFEISGSASRSQSKTVTLKVSLDDSKRIQIATSNREVREALSDVGVSGDARGRPGRAPAKKATAKRAPARKTTAKKATAKRAPARKTTAKKATAKRA